MSIFEWLADTPGSQAMGKGDYDRSLAKILGKIGEAVEKGDLARAAWLHQMASVLARRAGQWDDSVRNALKAAEYSEKEGRRFNAGWAYRSAAIASLEKGSHGDAVGYAVKGADSFMLAKSAYASKWCYNIAAEASKASGDLEKAIKFLEKAHSIEPDDETRSRISDMKLKVAHPAVDQYPERKSVTEYEPVKFEVTVENRGREPITNIIIGDRDAKVTHDIPLLEPGHVSVFAFEAKGRVGYVESPYNYIVWQNSNGDTLDMPLEPARVLVKPAVQVSSYISPEPVINRPSELVVLVKNMSSVPLFDVRIALSFRQQVRASAPVPPVIEKLCPGEEMGTEWKVEPAALGRQRMAEGSVTMRDEGGIEFEEPVAAVEAEVLEAPAAARGVQLGKGEYRLERKKMESGIAAYPLAEGAYVQMEKRLWHRQCGFTFRGIGLEAATGRVEENCREMAAVARHDFEMERILLYSFVLGGVQFLMTVVIKEEEGIVHLLLKLYSDSRDSLPPTLERIAGLIRYLVSSEADAREVEKVEIRKVINIIDSIVQRSSIGSGGEGDAPCGRRARPAGSVLQGPEA